MSTPATLHRARFWRHVALLWVWCLLSAPTSVWAQLPGSTEPFESLLETSLGAGEMAFDGGVVTTEAAVASSVDRLARTDSSGQLTASRARDSEEQQEWAYDWPSPLVPLSQAPLCDPTASSVVAPLPVLPSRGVELQSCWERDWEGVDRYEPVGHELPLQRFQALQDGATFASNGFSFGAPDSHLLIQRDVTLPAATGHGRGVERPPRG